MSPAELWVALATITGVAAVNWYFFFGSRQAAVARSASGGVQEVTIQVDGGYAPSLIELRAGQPARLVFDRLDDNSCTEEIVLPHLGIRKYLPAHAATAIEFTPAEPGQHEFTCGMSMLRGKLIVK